MKDEEIDFVKDKKIREEPFGQIKDKNNERTPRRNSRDLKLCETQLVSSNRF